MKKLTTPDEYFAHTKFWKTEQLGLREILRATEMEECLKWGIPCYTLNGKNLVGIGAFKSYFGLWFYQGALLSDPAGKLINAQEGKTVAMRQWRFQAWEEVDEELVKDYLNEAIAHQKAGREIKAQRNKPLEIPPELAAAFTQDFGFQKSFEALSIGKKREYAEYIAMAKQAATKTKRLEKIMPMILAGKGLNDKYK